MKIASPSTPSGYTIFCDDIRYEVNGKVALNGVYGGDIVVAELPTTLPQLCFRIMYYERRNESDESVEVRIYTPAEDAPIVTIPIDRQILKNTPDQPKTDESENLITIAMNVATTSLILKEEGLLRVRAFRGDTEIRLGSLRVRKAAPIQQSATT